MQYSFIYSKVSIMEKMEEITKVNGKMGKWMAKGNISGKTEISTKGIL